MQTPEGGHRSSRVPLAAAAAVALIVILVGAVAATRPSGADRVIGLLGDEDAFGSSRRAVESFADVAEMLRAEGEQCTGADRPCAQILSAAAWAQVAAFSVANCTQTYVGQARLALRDYLIEVTEQGTRPDLPPPVRC